MTTPLLLLLSFVARRAKANFVRKTRQVENTQAAFLRSLLKVQRHTELGRKLGLGTIKTVQEFRDRVPILPYSSYEPYLERAIQGEPNLLTPDPLIYLNLTSGSTGRQKLIPVTRRSRQKTMRASRVGIGFAVEAAQSRGLSLGKMLLTTSAQSLGRTSGNIEYGHVSGGDLRMSTAFYRQVFAQPFDALLISDSLSRIYVCLLFALSNTHLSVIGANFPVIALQLGEYLEQYAESLIEDLKTGLIANWIKLEPELRAKLEQQFSASPRRANQLQHLLTTTGRLTPKAVWPQLSFVITARGGTSDFYFERFPDYFGDVPVFGGTYSSAEATFGIHHNFNTDGTVLAIESGFFEFVPSDQWQAEKPKTLLPHEVKAGEFYRILVTNYNGFYRYDLGDVVEVTGFYEQAPLIVFRYRQGGTLSALTEKTTEYHATQVVQALQQEFNLGLEDFCITLSERLTAAYYVLNIELAAGQTLDNPVALLARFDEKLQEANASYALKRPKNDIPAPRLRILQAGSFANLRQRPLAQGVQNAQLKIPHISSDRSFLAGLIVEQEVKLPDDIEPSPSKTEQLNESGSLA